jgi:membrane-associated phospholipid phosphatase
LRTRSLGRQVGRYGAGCAVAIVLAGSVPALAATNEPTDADTIAPAEAGPVAPAGEGDGRRTIGRLPANLGRGVVGVFHKDNLVPFLVGGAATGAVSFADDSVRDALSDPESGFGKTMETIGAWPDEAAAVALFVAGRFAHGQRFRAMTYDLVDASIVNLSYTALLKVTVRRERPDGSNNQSFPSGHASSAFALATVAERHYGWKVGVPAYAFAAAMGYSRLLRDKHYLSDVVAGATLGYIAGRTAVRVNSQAIGHPGGATLNISPIVTRHTRGLQVSLMY